MKKRLVSFALALCMILTQLPIPAMAEEADTSVDASGEIIAFAPLDETEKSVSTGTAIEDLGLPESLTATVKTAVPDDSGTTAEPVQDSGEPEESVTSENPATSTSSSALQGDMNEQQKATAPKWEEKIVEIPVKWTSDPEYDMDTKGDYVFTPVIEGYTVSTDLPEITVTVDAQPLMRALTATDYGIWVGTTKVTSDNASNVTGDGISGTVTYDASINTLTLNNASITSLCLPGTGTGQNGNEYGVSGGIFKNSGDLKIALIGSNMVDISSVTGQTQSFGINSMGKLQISGEETSSLTVISAPNTTSSFGISGSLGVAISGCTVTAKAGSSGGTTNPNSSGIVTGSGTLSITDAHVTAIGGNTSGNKVSFGITASGNVVITGSTVNATGGTVDNGQSCGMYVNNTYTDVYYKNVFSDSIITAVGDTRALNITGSPTTTGLAATAGANKDGAGATPVAIDSGVYSTSNFYKYVQIIPVTPTSQANWGVAGDGGTAPSTWTGGTLADAVEYARKLSSGTAYIQLLSNVTTTDRLIFYSEKPTILDLNGKIIDRGLTSSTINGNVITVMPGGNLTLKDSSAEGQGKITGGYNTASGGGVFMNGSFTMQGGNITGNKSSSNTGAGGGGGVYVDNGGFFTMTGGSINNNEAKNSGGGVFVNGSFTMQGGNITGNKSSSNTGAGGGGGVYVNNGSFTMTNGSINNNEAIQDGGGVYGVNGSFTMLGGAITGNKSATGGVYFASNSTFTVGNAVVIDNNLTTDAIPAERNVMLTGKTITVSTATPLTAGASIGVTPNAAPTSASPRNVTGAGSADYSGYFFSDNSAYMIQNSGSGSAQVVQLAVPAPGVTVGTLTIPGSFTAGNSITLSNLDAYKPTVTATGGATVTAEGWQIPVYGGGWTNWSTGNLIPYTGSASTLRYYVTYSGGTVYSNEVTLNVVGHTPALELTASPASPQNTGTPITLTATLTGFFANAGVNNHTITFKNGTTTLGTAALNADGVATYIWTPGEAAYSLTAEYAATDYNKAATSNTLNYTVNANLPTAAMYAADAASGTDYVLNDTNKTLTIKTAKGAAFWSANGAPYLSYTIKLVSSIDVSGFQWAPVGDGSNKFTGTFDGQRNTITGLTVNLNGQYAGLFGSISGATIKNVGLVGSTVSGVSTSASAFAGGIAGLADGSTIANCYNTGTVKASCDTPSFAAGGIAGKITNYGYITNCYNTGGVGTTATGNANDYYSGGIAGLADDSSTIQNCYSTGTISATGSNISNAFHGGIAGGVFTSGHIYKCYYLTSSVEKGIGSQWDAIISNCGTFLDNGGTLTAGTADQFVWAQTLENDADTLLNALNGWVNAKASADYNTWQADSATPTNGGYPLLNAAWTAHSSLDLTSVSCDVAAGKLTGTTANMQYSLDGGGTWRDCVADSTTGLTFSAGTVKVRQKDETTNERTIITIAAAVTSNAPTLESKTYNSVTLTAMAGYEYSKDGGATWQNSNLFSSLSSSTTYSFVARVKATAATLPSKVSTALNVTTNEVSSGNGGSNGGGSTTPPSTKPTEPVTGRIENKATVDNKGNASVSLTDKNITDAIADAKAEAAKKGVNPGDITAVIHVTTDAKDASTVTVNLPKTTQVQVIGNKIASVQLVIDRPDLTIGIDLAAVTEINRQAKADVQLSATLIDNAKLSGDAKAAIGNRPAYDLKALYGSGKTVTNFGNGSVSVEIPYTLQKGEIAGNVYAVYVDVEGKVTYLTDSSYDAKRGTVVFSTSHFSTYGVAYKASFQFTDIDGHWAKDDILFVANRGLMTGTSATTFSPNGSMTRGMFVTALGRLANADISAYKKSNFTDVKADAYYMGYIEWGVKNNILVGIGGGKFDPDGLVTREQMAAIMDRYATAIGFKLSEVHGQNVFADNSKIGAWAAPSVKRIQMAGIILGKNNNFYDPQGTATRAEVSAVLRRFVELTVFSDTEQG